MKVNQDYILEMLRMNESEGTVGAGASGHDEPLVMPFGRRKRRVEAVSPTMTPEKGKVLERLKKPRPLTISLTPVRSTGFSGQELPSTPFAGKVQALPKSFEISRSRPLSKKVKGGMRTKLHDVIASGNVKDIFQEIKRLANDASPSNPMAEVVKAEPVSDSTSSLASVGGIEWSINVSQLAEKEQVVRAINRADENGYTPLILAASLRTSAKGLPSSPPPPSSAAAAAAAAAVDDNVDDAPLTICKLLIALKAESRAVDRNGRTAAHWAAWANNVEVLKYLVRSTRAKVNPGAGILKNCKSHLGETPLLMASKYGRLECVRALLDMKGIKVSTRDIDSSDVCELACVALPRSSSAQKKLARQLRQSICEEVHRKFDRSRTLILQHSDCLGHSPRRDDGGDASANRCRDGADPECRPHRSGWNFR